MTSQYNYQNQYYYTLDTRFNVNGVLFGAGASAIEVAIGSLLSYGKGNAVTQSMKFLIKEGVASEVITTSVEIGFNNEVVTINGVIVSFIGELAVQNLLTAIITSVVGASAATGFVNIVAIAAASSLIWSAATAIGEEINTEVDAFYNDVLNGSLVDLKFVNSSGDHTSGLMLPSETYGVLGIKGSIIAYLNNTSENVDGGYLTFADGRDGDQLTGTAYQIFNGSTFQAIANKLEVSLEQFLSSGIGGLNNNDLYISGFNKVAFAKTADITSSSKIYIPLKINGVTQIIAVDGVFNGSESLSNLLVGRSSEVIFGTSRITYPDALILDSNSNAPIIVRTGRSEGQEEGNYIIIGSDGADNLSVYKSAIIDGGDGIDTIDYSSLGFGSRDIDVNLANHTATNGISINSFTNTLYNIENIIGSKGDDSITGDSNNNSLSGGDGDDNLSGAGGNDTLDGGTGEDALTGGSGNDILKGSTGFDSYNFSGNYGLDTIIDSDQSGRIIINGIIFEGTATIVEVASTKSYSTYEMQSGGKSYTLVASNGSLLISDSSNNSVNNLLQNQIVIKNFSNGNFGITLDNTDDEEPNPDTSSPDTSNPNSILQNFKDYFRDLLDDKDDTQSMGDYIEDLLNSLTQAEATPFNNPRYDPLTLDLDGDGVELISLNKSTAFFDLDNDSLREKVGWVKADDGILVLDSNGNNSVDNITELFGYRREDGVQVTGTEELRTHDSNNDGKIDANDAIFSKLKIWQDTNQNGISEVNELKTLSDYGITSINVAQSGVTDLNQLQEGNLIISKSTYTKTITNNDGSTTEVTRDYANLDLAIDQTNSSSYSYQDESGNNITYDLNLDVLNLPMSRGYGNLKAWHIAMSEDEALLNIMKEIVSVAAQDSELSYKDLNQQIESFIYQWSHVQDIGLISMRGSFSAQKLAAMEAIRGVVFLGQGAGGNIAPTQVNLVQSAWDSLVKDVTAKVLIQGVFSDLFTSAKYDFATDSIDFGDLSKEVLMTNIKAKFDQLSGSTEQYYFISALSDLAEDVGGKVENIATADAFKSDLVETLGFRIDDFKLGGIGNDTLNATSSGNYFFDGAEGNDTIISSSGDDIISGGKGDDVIDGGVGNDTYIYNIGDGHDVITDNPSWSVNYGNQLTDIISFGVGITVDDLVLSRGGNDLVISFKNSASDSITFKNHFSPYTNSQYRNSKLEYLEFTTLAADGSISKSRVATNSLVTLSYDGTEENDDIGIYNHAFDGNDIIKTLGGNDKVFADYGNDQIEGGAGDDFLSGYYGDDTYIYNLGDGADTINELSQSASYQRPGSNWEDLGNDTILFGEGISRSDLVFSTPNSRELVISFRNSTSDKITINNFFAGTNAKVENLKFSEGSFIDISFSGLFIKPRVENYQSLKNLGLVAI